MTYLYECVKCKRFFDEVRSVAERCNVFCCGKRAIKHICTNPQINADLLYNFQGEFRGEKVQIHSKRQYNRILKNKGLVDVTVPEVKSVREKQMKLGRKHNLGKLSDRIQSKVAKDGLTKHLTPFINNFHK